MHRKIVEQIERGVLVLTVNRRLARVLAQRYEAAQIEKGRKAWPTARVLPLSSWLQQQWQECCFQQFDLPLMIDDHQSLLQWEQIINESNDGLLNVAATARSATQAWRLMQQWQLSEDDIPRQHNLDVEAFRKWMLAYKQRAAQGNWLDSASLVQAVLTQLSQIEQSLPAHIKLYGFDEITPQLQALISTLKQSGCEVEVEANIAPSGAVTRVACASQDEELYAVARWLRQLIETGAVGRTAVVVPQLQQLRSRLEVVFDDVLLPGALLPTIQSELRPYDISLGRPLTEFPIVIAALGVLNLLRGRIEIESLGGVLLSPFIGAQEEELMARATLDFYIRQQGELQISLWQLQRYVTQDAFAKQLPQFKAAIAALVDITASLPRRALPSAWVVRFKQVLQAIGWSEGRSLDSAEYQAVLTFKGLIEQFARLDTTLSELSYAEALRRLRQLAQASLFQPMSRNQPIQVMGVLETAGLEFDNLWLMGMNDHVWPPAPQPTPFLPIGLQLRLDMPHASAERELAFARQQTERLLHSASQVVVSYALQEGDQDQRPSPLISDLPEQPLSSLFHITAPPFYRDVIHAESELESFIDWQAPPLLAGARARGGATLFKDQAACPFRAFAKHRLAARVPEIPASGLDAAERGNLVHLVLEKLWQKLQSHEGLVQLSDDQCQQLVEKTVAEVIEKEKRRLASVFSQRFTVLEQDRLVRLMNKWLAVEVMRQPFTVEATEEARIINIAGLEVRLKVDRIDRLENGEAMMIDYKTGSNFSVANWFDPRPAEPQLPLYCVSHDAPVSALAFAQVNAKQARLIGLSNEVEVTKGVGYFSKSKYNIGKPSWDDLQAEWRQVLEKLAQDFLAGRAEVDPKEGSATCEYCDLGLLCRVNELSGAEVENDG